MTATLAGLACMIAAMLAHATLCRWLRPAQYIRAAMLCLLLSMVAGGMMVVLSGLVLFADDWLLFLVLVPSLMSTYVLIFFGIGWDSPTLALANAILDRGAAGLPRDALDEFVARHPFVDSRLQAMVQAGVVTEQGEVLQARADIGLAVRLAGAYRRLCGLTDMAG
jgi:hypothetical protein